MNTTSDSLSSALLTTLEEWSFFMVEPDVELRPFGPDLTCLCGQVRFEGEGESGQIAVTVPVEWANALARNVLGLDEDDDVTQEQSTDALRELLNITGGHYLTTHYGQEKIFRLGIPEVTSLSGAQWERQHKDAPMVRLLVEESPLRAVVTAPSVH